MIAHAMISFRALLVIVAMCVLPAAATNASTLSAMPGNASEGDNATAAIVFEGEERVMAALLAAWRPHTWPPPDNISVPLGHCTWDGIKCNAEGDVIHVRLTVKDVEGTIPAAIGELQHLEQFYLYSNSIRGTIPPEIGQLKKLTHLSLGENKIKGTIPSTIGDMDSLKFLYLNGNRLRGTIPAEIGKLRALQHIGLWANGLEVRLSHGNRASI